MTRRGRPLRFLALVLAGWVGARVAILWPRTGSLPAAIRAAVPGLAPASSDWLRIAASPPKPRVIAGSAKPAGKAAAFMRATPPPRDPRRVQLALMGMLQYGRAILLDAGEAEAGEERSGAMQAPPLLVPPLPPGPIRDRWSGSAWMAVRGGTGIGGAPGAGQLGGGQIGGRIVWLADPGRRIAIAGRMASPLHGSGREAALAVEWQPGRLPVRLMAERRFALDRGRGGFGVGAFGGVDSVSLAGDFRLEAYGQAGAVARQRIEPYADGAARITRPIGEAGRLRLAIGAGGWGAAQRDAQRLDIGPTLTAGMPVAGRNMRLLLDWRERVAGEARPGSGVVLTLGADF